MGILSYRTTVTGKRSASLVAHVNPQTLRGGRSVFSRQSSASHVWSRNTVALGDGTGDDPVTTAVLSV